MRLQGANQNDCVAASLAMLLGVSMDYIKGRLFVALTRPFPNPWAEFPKVPDMNVICDWLWEKHKVALTPFEYDPQCSPHKDCPPVSVYPQTCGSLHVDADWAFDKQTAYGPGLFEGSIVGKEIGHMCAWDGQTIFDPRGYCYSRNVAQTKFNYQITRFWLATKGEAL